MPRRRAKWMLFAPCAFLLLEEHLALLGEIIIDNEYDGHQHDIEAALLRYIWRVDSNFESWRIEVRSIGKASQAHNKAWAAYAGEESVDRTVTTEEILELIG